MKYFAMKRLIAFAIVMVHIASVMNGQSFVEPERRWNVQVDFFMAKSMELFSISGDTTFNGSTYSKIWISYDSMQTTTYAGALRESNGQVYYAAPGNPERLLYDFTLELGDTVRITNYFCTNQDFSVAVTAVDSVIFQGTQLRRWHMTVVDSFLTGGELTDKWIEGIGSLYGPLYSMYNYCIVCPTWDLLCCYHHDSLIFMNPAANTCYQVTNGIDEPERASPVKVFPNPAVDHFRIQPTEGQIVYFIEIFNLQGQRVFSKWFSGETDADVSNLRRGVYLIRISDDNGRLVQNERILLQ
jgi:hypothetical protein